jgi:flagellar hook protein FlgE
MSLFTTMNTAASGLGVSSGSLEVIGDNIANMNTVGFKGTRAEFADYLPQDVYGLAGPSQIGKGAGMNNLQTLFGQGSLDSSQNPLDMAISGDGFFVVSDGEQDFYSRAGQYYLDNQGYVVNAQGYVLQGYNVDDAGTLGATVGDLQIDLNTVQPAATTDIALTATLDSTITTITGGVTALTLLGTAASGSATLEEAANAADFATSVTIYDSLGNPHEATVLWEYNGFNAATGTSQWNYSVVVDGGEVDAPSGTTLEDGYAFEIASGTVDFDGNGEIDQGTVPTLNLTAAWEFTGANPQAIDYDFGYDFTTATFTGDGDVRAIAGASAVSGISQNGYPPGELSNLSVDSDGVVTGSYTNGEEYTLGQVVLARFSANAELERVGNTLFRETLASGSPAIGAADTGGRGRIAGNALEQSNVDLEREFVTMITAQRTYQANARMIDTANSTLQELVQLV